MGGRFGGGTDVLGWKVRAQDWKVNFPVYTVGLCIWKCVHQIHTHKRIYQNSRTTNEVRHLARRKRLHMLISTTITSRTFIVPIYVVQRRVHHRAKAMRARSCAVKPTLNKMHAGRFDAVNAMRCNFTRIWCGRPKHVSYKGCLTNENDIACAVVGGAL